MPPEMTTMPLLDNTAKAGASTARVITVLGAESTGKTTLAQALVTRLVAQGMDAVMVPELLRRFCEQHQRTPLAHEQAPIAQAQTHAIAQAAAQHAWVVADTSALMTAVYSEMVFGDTSLYEMALQAHARSDLTLLTALDLPWEADGLQRDGPHVREPVDTLIRQALISAGLPFVTVCGQGEWRTEQAWAAIQHQWLKRTAEDVARPRWRWLCEKCDDGDCEQHAPLTSLQSAR